MRRPTSLIPLLALAALGACRSTESKAGGGEAQMVSLVVRSEPPGARVRVNRLLKTWITPCDIADFSIPKGMIDLEISLEGYDPVTPRVFYDGEHPVKVDAKLVSRRPPAPAAEPARPPAADPEPQAGIQVRVEPVQGGSRVTIAPARVRVRIASDTLMTDGDRAGVYFLANVPPGKAVVEVLDPLTNAVLQVLTIPGGATPAAAAAPQAPAVQEVVVPAATSWQAPIGAPPQAAPPYFAAPAVPPIPATPTYYYYLLPYSLPPASPAPSPPVYPYAQPR